MKHPPVAKQAHQYARTFPLGHLPAQFDKQCLDVDPVNICRDRPGENEFKGALVLSLHWLNGSK